MKKTYSISIDTDWSAYGGICTANERDGITVLTGVEDINRQDGGRGGDLSEREIDRMVDRLLEAANANLATGKDFSEGLAPGDYATIADVTDSGEEDGNEYAITGTVTVTVDE